MTLPSALAAGRRAAESRMTSTALVRRVDPDNPATDANGFEVDGWADVYAALPAWIDKGRGTRRVTVGDVEMELAVRVLKCPHDTDQLRDGDIAEVAGRFYRFAETTPVDQKKQQEFEVVETDRPGGWS